MNTTKTKSILVDKFGVAIQYLIIALLMPYRLVKSIFYLLWVLLYGLVKLIFYFITPRKKDFNKKIFLPKLVINFLVATLVVLGLHYFEDSLLFKEAKDIALDWIMYFYSDYDTGGQRMALFEIDDLIYREWGSPATTPRAELNTLIEKAKQGGASVIAVDIALTRLSDGCFHEPGKTPVCLPVSSDTDEELGLYLQQLNEVGQDKFDAPIVLLIRTYRKPLDESGEVKTEAFLEKPYSFLEAYLKEQKNVFWTSTFFAVDEDRVRRRWQLASLVCEKDQLTVVPSMQLLAAMARCEKNTRQAADTIRAFKHRLNTWANTLSCDTSNGTTIPKICQNIDCPDLTVTLPNQSGACDQMHTIDLAGERETERVVYRFAPADNPIDNQLSLIDKHRAQQILSSKEAEDVDRQIVFIGVTHQNSGDFHPVPIRFQEVAGVYIVANAVDTLLRFGQFQPQKVTHKIALSIVLVVLLTLIFSVYELITAYMFSSFVVGVVLFGASYQALHHGLWIDMALAMMAIQVVQFILLFVEKLWEGVQCAWFGEIKINFPGTATRIQYKQE